MIKQFLIKNWMWIVLAGVVLFVYMEQNSQNRAKDDIIEGVKKENYRQIAKAQQRIDSLIKVVHDTKKELEFIDSAYSKVAKDVKILQHERIKIINTVPTYSDAKLDSILTNYRHR